MKLFDINWRPTDRQLRQFGFACLVALPTVGWLWGGGTTVVAALAFVGLTLMCIGVLAPRWLKPIFLGLTLLAAPIGLVVAEISLLLIYFGVLLPIALLFRIAGRDALQLRVDRDAKSYWQRKRRPKDVGSYYRQS